MKRLPSLAIELPFEILRNAFLGFREKLAKHVLRLVAGLFRNGRKFPEPFSLQLVHVHLEKVLRPAVCSFDLPFFEDEDTLASVIKQSPEKVLAALQELRVAPQAPSSPQEHNQTASQ